MANSAVYKGPSDVFIVDGVEYRRGDSIPNVSREQLWAWMNHGGHRFDVTVERPNAQPATVAEANTERGEVAASVIEAANAHAAQPAPGGVLAEDARIVPVEEPGAGDAPKGKGRAGGSGSGEAQKPAGGGAGGGTAPTTT